MRNVTRSKLQEWATILASGETVNDGRFTVTVSTEYEPYTMLGDSGDWFGKIDERNRDELRPSHFDGGARKVAHGDGRYYDVWWQPPADALNDPERLAMLYSYVRGWYNDEWNFETVKLTVTERHPDDPSFVKADISYTGCVESNTTNEHMADILTDMLREHFTITED